MTAEEFVSACEANWKPYTDEQRQWLVKDCKPYEEQLEEIFTILRKTSRWQPKSWDVENAAEELGFEMAPPTAVRNLSEYNITSCRLCHGCGLLTVYHELEGFKPGAVLGVYPYCGASQRQDFTWHNQENRKIREFVYRCLCPSGGEMSLAYPLYRGKLVRPALPEMTIPPEFELWVAKFVEEIPF